jgi:nicotinic acid phosphoribosyltransferase
MRPELRDRLVELRQMNEAYQADMERMSQEVDALGTRKAALEDELAVSAVKKEALALTEQLRLAEEKRDALIEEDKCVFAAINNFKINHFSFFSVLQATWNARAGEGAASAAGEGR